MATLADVARHAGVAASTVSYVLSGKRTVSASTRRRVEHSIELLNYHTGGHPGRRGPPGRPAGAPSVRGQPRGGGGRGHPDP
jgi:hypothetical protein